MIIALPNRREVDTLHSLKQAGLSISTRSTRRRVFNVAHRPVPVLTNVVSLGRYHPASQALDWLIDWTGK